MPIRLIRTHHSLIALSSLLVLSACETTPNTIESPAPETVTVEQAPSISPAPILSPQAAVIELTQTRLKNLGYKTGVVDGIWGKRSATAMIEFEKDTGLTSAGGYLSELNLEVLSRLSPASSIQKKTKSTINTPKSVSLGDQIDQSKIAAGTPQLIILEQDYPLLSKTNPYSAQVQYLKAGTGIYVTPIKESNWFKVETLDDKQGFINTQAK